MRRLPNLRDTVGETVPPVSEAVPEEAAAEPAGPVAVTADDDDEFAGGGLMVRLRGSAGPFVHLFVQLGLTV